MAERWNTSAIICTALGVGLAAGAKPMVAGGLAVLMLAVTVVVATAPRLPRIFFICLWILVCGYAIGGRAFAYLGIPPLYVGEMVMAIGVGAILSNAGLNVSLRSPLAWLWLALAAWCASRTVPYIALYRIDALRDAVLWGYGVFTIFVAAFLQREGSLEAVSRAYARFAPWFILWVPVLWAVTQFGMPQPQLPLSNKQVLEFAPSCASVHLAGTGTFLLLDLHKGRDAVRKGLHRLPGPLLWTVWFIGFALVALHTRGGALGIIVPMLVVLVARPRTARKLALVGGIAVVFSMMFTVFNLSFDTGRYRGTVSPEELVRNVTSIFHEDQSDAANREGNRAWRLDWWNTILGYTVHGPLFWTGKGFGINLADDDGFQVNELHSLRSPHNGHLTFLARGGVPAVALWLALQAAFAFTMAHAYLRARRARHEWWQRIDLWIFAYWLSFLANAAFDVFLESPQGGIWFWSIIGVGIVAAEQQRRLVAPARNVTLPTSARPAALIGAA
ncbi:MAG: O-antigen ligase family protein [Gemmatimonadaceae bacterium]